MHRTIIAHKKKTLSFFRRVSFFIFLLFSNVLFSQTFETIYSTNIDDCSYEGIEGNNYYFISVNSGFFYNSNYQGKVLKLNKNGKIIDSLYIPIHNGFISSDIWKIEKLNDSLFLCISIERNNLDEMFLQIIHFTAEFSITFDTLIYDYPSNNYMDFMVNSDSNIVTVGYITQFQEQFIKICDRYGNEVGYNTYFGNYGALASTVIEVPLRNKYHLFIDLSNDSYFFEINKETLLIDTILNYPDYFWPRNAIKGFNDSSYYIAGSQNALLYNGVRKLSFVEMDIYGDSINQSSYLISPDTNQFYSTNSISIFENNIFLGGTYNFTLTTQFPFLDEYRWIFINKLNPDGSIIWQRFYKGDANYVPFKVLATTDGGALILSTKYDWNDPIPYQRDLHILKVDSTGWYEGLTTGETEYDRPKQILVYPNPAKDKVNFVTGFYNNLTLKLYNLQGAEVLSKQLPYTQTIDVSRLHKGTYIYLITGENGFVEKGKLMKE